MANENSSQEVYAIQDFFYKCFYFVKKKSFEKDIPASPLYSSV